MCIPHELGAFHVITSLFLHLHSFNGLIQIWITNNGIMKHSMELPVVLILNYIFDLFVIFNPTFVYLLLTLYTYIYCNNLVAR